MKTNKKEGRKQFNLAILKNKLIGEARASY